MGLLTVKDLKVHFPIKGGFFGRTVDHVRAVDGVSLEIEAGKTYGLIGESGSGKSTIGKAIIGLEKATDGEILFNGQPIKPHKVSRKEEYRHQVQMIFQDVGSCLNPRKQVRDIISTPLKNFFNLTKSQEKTRILDLLNMVGLSEIDLYKYPSQFSGGQRQRIGIARALASRPKLIIADEPVSALDLSVQAQVLNYMKDIQNEFGLSFLFISHDLGVVKHMCEHLYIMYKGRFAESGTMDDIFHNPQHLYTRRLLSSITVEHPSQIDEKIQKREIIEKEYIEKSKYYFDQQGRLLNLKPVNNSSTHWVALNTLGGQSDV